MAESAVIVKDFSLGAALAGVLFFLPWGLLLLLKPRIVQSYALHLYQYPGDERKAAFFRSPGYVVMLRIVGFFCTAVGLFLAGLTVAALLVPGFEP
jgi:hypothetical protein